ncbi:MAG: NAD-binding protein [Methanoregulaceae archaeon]|nr:NAD-binding protein [Methanoregulaceae archaeon]
MISDRRRRQWRLFFSSQRVMIGFFFLLFFLQIIAYTTVFHYIYPILEQKPISWPTALLFVVETITTTGYGELLPFTSQITVLVTILMMISGIIVIFMIIPLILIPILANLLHAAPPKKIPRELRNHIVIIGFGELTRSLIESLMISELEIVVIEDDEETARSVGNLYGKRVFVVWGDYGESRTWNHAYVRFAGTVIVDEDERTAATIILGIRDLTDARIIAVVDKLSFDRYLRYAGAEYVLSPKHVTGQILARDAMLTSHIDTIVDETLSGHRLPHDPADEHVGHLRILNIPVPPGSKAVGKSLKELDLFGRYGFDVLFISRSGHFEFHPGPDELIDPATMLFLIGKTEHIAPMVEQEFLPRDSGSSTAVIAGYGDVGAAAYHEMVSVGMDCMVIDQHPQPVSQVIGNAEDEDILRKALIETARFCIIAINDDDVNIFATLMARSLNPDIRILARANEPASVDKLYRAGADYVALLPNIGGQIIAAVVLSDIVRIVLNLPNGQKVVRKRVMKQINRPVTTVEKQSGIRILGIEGRDRSIVRPEPDERLQAGDTLIVTGGIKQLKTFIRTV